MGNKDLSLAERLEIELNNTLTSISMFKSADIMNDGKILLIRINNSLKSDRFTDDAIECAKQVKQIVPNYFPTYKSWVEFEYGVPKEFIVYIFVNTEK